MNIPSAAKNDGETGSGGDISLANKLESCFDLVTSGEAELAIGNRRAAKSALKAAEESYAMTQRLFLKLEKTQQQKPIEEKLILLKEMLVAFRTKLQSPAA